MRVSLFVTCLTDTFYPDVAECVVRILRRLGHQVEFPKEQTCCGQPALNSGFFDEARAIAGRMIRVFRDAEVVVTPSGSCCSIVREYHPHLFKDDPVMYPQAVALANKTFETVEFLQKKLKVDWSKWKLSYPAVATYHYSCHNRGIEMTPEDVEGLIRQFHGLEYRRLDKIDQCCGFGGTFSVKQSVLSGAIGREKVKCIQATGAPLVICNDGGCTMNIQGACRRAGVNVEFKHIMQILDHAMATGRSREAAGRVVAETTR
ncbi:MAG: (Fe-S)-binding protein [Phycisphaerae bacterium]|nr:(Fe-S)-binding protein [Phycisphaerae bacterium]